MSTYIEKMKNTLLSFNSVANETSKQMDRARESHKPDVAAREVAKLCQQLNAAAEIARKDIETIRRGAIKAVQQWAAPEGAEIDTADMELLRGGFDVSAQDLHALLVKHQGSGVMVNAIAKYAREHKITLLYIPSVADKERAYTSFAASANGMISKIAGNIGISDTSYELTLWGKPGNISQHNELVIYGLKPLEEPQGAPKASFDFGFKGLSGRNAP